MILKIYRLYQIDAFAEKIFGGNPAGVVPNADGLTENQMQKIAREMNNSETAFVFKSDSSDYDIEVRFFTPTTEINLCGHATISTHFVRALEGDAKIGITLQKTKAGILPVEVVKDGENFSVVMSQGKIKIDDPYSPELVKKIADALKISPDDFNENCPIAGADNKIAFVGIKSNELLHNLQPDLAALEKISSEINRNGFYVFTLNPGEKFFVHGRMFAPAWGIAEDPVTGIAGGGIGSYFVNFGICRELEKNNRLEFEIIQGEKINRAGEMKVIAEIAGGRAENVKIVGRAVVAFKSEFIL